MIKKKICMVGAFAVGKTCLVQQYVSSLFSQKYLTTVGVKIDCKQIDVDGSEVQLMLWDIQGEDELSDMRLNYLKGAAGILFVVDGTRLETLETAMAIRSRVNAASGTIVPSIALFNKADLSPQWEVTDDDISDVTAAGMPAFITSAKNGHAVDSAFQSLARMTLG